MSPSSSMNQMDLKARDWPDGWLTVADTPRWWGDADAQDRLAGWMLNRDHEPSSRAGSNLDGSFVELSQAARRTAWTVSPRLLGAFVVNELARSTTMGMTPKDLIETVSPWLDAGAVAEVPAPVLEHLQTMHRSGTPRHQAVMALLGRLEANALTQALGEASPSGTAPGAHARRRL